MFSNPITAAARRGVGAALLLSALLGAPAIAQPGRVYVADEGTNSIAVIDPATNSVTATIGLSGTPGIPAATQSGDRIFVPLRTSNQVAVIDTETNTVISTINHASFAEPVAAATFAARGEVWVVNRSGGPGNNGSITVIDTNSLAFSRSILSAEFNAPEHIAFSPVGAQAYVVNTGGATLTQVLGSNYTVSFSVAVGATPRFAIAGPNGRFVYVSNEGASTLAVVDSTTRGVTFVGVPGSPRNMTLPSGSPLLYIALQNNLVAVYNIQTQAMQTVSFPTPGFVSHAVALQTGTRLGYVSNRGGGNVASFDTVELTPVGGNGNPVAGLSAPRALLSAGVVAVSDLSVTTTAAPAAALGGQPVTYSVEVANAGPSVATETRLTFELSAPYQLLSANPGQGSCSPGETELVCELGNVGLGAGVPVSFNVAILAAGVVTAGFEVEAEETDPNPANNSAVANTTVTAAADLSISITDQPDPVTAGDLLVYTVRIDNLGPSPASGVRFFDPLPPGVTLDSLEVGLGNCIAGNTSILCNLESIPAGQGSTIVIRVIPGRGSGNLLNAVDVRSDVVDPNPSNNAAVALTTVRVGSNDLTIAKRTSTPLANPGSAINFELEAANLGPRTASGVRVTDTLPSGLEFLAFPEADSGCEFSQGAVRCDFGRLETGESRSAAFRVQVTAGVGDTIENVASVTGDDADPDSGNNQATAVVAVVERGDLNGDGVVNAADVQELVLEINDGDGEAVEDAAGGSHPGNATMDVNGDGLINRADLEALAGLILG